MRRISLAALAAMAVPCTIAAQPAPLDHRIGGIFIGDQTLDAISSHAI